MKSDERKPELDPRVLMAAERTLLAWIRTGVAMMGFGFVVARFGLFLRELAAASGHPATHHIRASPIIGTALILLGSVAVAVSLFDYAHALRRYERGLPSRVRLLSPATVLSAILCLAGVGLAGYLMFV